MVAIGRVKGGRTAVWVVLTTVLLPVAAVVFASHRVRLSVIVEPVSAKIPTAFLARMVLVRAAVLPFVRAFHKYFPPGRVEQRRLHAALL